MLHAFFCYYFDSISGLYYFFCLSAYGEVVLWVGCLSQGEYVPTLKGWYWWNMMEIIEKNIVETYNMENNGETVFWVGCLSQGESNHLERDKANTAKRRSQRHKNMGKFSVFLQQVSLEILGPEFKLYLHKEIVFSKSLFQKLDAIKCVKQTLRFCDKKSYYGWLSCNFFPGHLYDISYHYHHYIIYYGWLSWNFVPDYLYLPQIHKIVLRLVILQVLLWPPLFATNTKIICHKC